MMSPSTLNILARVQSGLTIKPAYTLDQFANGVQRSRKTAYRYLAELKRLGFVTSSSRGAFVLRDSVFLPPPTVLSILPSLRALAKGMRFRLRNGKLGVSRAKVLLEKLGGLTTLDYAAYELTSYQTPDVLYFYPNSFDEAVSTIRKAGYVESPKGKIVLLPRIGDFSHPTRRIYYDCLANGGRSILDAMAIARSYPEVISEQVILNRMLDLAAKVGHDMRRMDNQRQISATNV